MNIAPAQEVMEDEDSCRYTIESSGLPPAAFVYNAGAEMLRSGRTSATLVLPRSAYRQVTRENNLSELRDSLTNGEFLYARDRLTITSQKELQGDQEHGETFVYSIVFTFDGT